MLTKREIETYRKIYKSKYGLDMSDSDLLREAENLLWFIKLVAKPGIDKKLKQLHLIT